MLHIFKKGKKRKNIDQNKFFEEHLEEIIHTTIKSSINNAFADLQEKLAAEQDNLYSKLQKRISKQNVMLEELIEIAEENKEEKHKLEITLDKEHEEKEKLLKLIMQYQEYMDLIILNIRESYHTNNEQDDSGRWLAQLDLVNSDLNNTMSLLGMEKISSVKVKVNTGLHEIIEVAETKDPAASETVLKILVPGCIYNGVVLRKAKIIASIYNES